jgi:hypothetical protein
MPSKKITELTQVASVTKTDLILLATNVNSTPTSRAIQVQNFSSYYGEVVTKTANYILTDTDYFVAVDSSSGDIDITLPTAVGRSGRSYRVKKIVEANKVNVKTNGAETIDGEASCVLNTQYHTITLISNGTNWYILSQYLPV